MSKTNSAAATVTASAVTFDGATFAAGILRDKRRGAAGMVMMKQATILIDVLRAMGAETLQDQIVAIVEITSIYRQTLTDKGAGAHGDAVRLIAGI